MHFRSRRAAHFSRFALRCRMPRQPMLLRYDLSIKRPKRIAAARFDFRKRNRAKARNRNRFASQDRCHGSNGRPVFSPARATANLQLPRDFSRSYSPRCSRTCPRSTSEGVPAAARNVREQTHAPGRQPSCRSCLVKNGVISVWENLASALSAMKGGQKILAAPSD